MAVLIKSYPSEITALYSNEQKFIFKELSAVVGVLTFKVIITINSTIIREFVVYPGTDQTGEINLRYILQNYIKTEFADIESESDVFTLLRYDFSVQGFDGSTAIDAPELIILRKVLNAATIPYEQDLVPLITYGSPLSKSGGIHVASESDKLTVQYLNNPNFQITEVRIKQYNWDGDMNEDRDLTAYFGIVPSSSTFILTLNFSGIILIAETVRYEILVNGVVKHTVYLDGKHPRFDGTRVRYINKNGATDYFNFSLAENEALDIKTNTFTDSEGKQSVYSREAEHRFMAYSDYITEEESKSLRDLWISPQVEVWKNNNFQPIILDNKKVKVLRKKESGLIQYVLSYYYSETFNLQK